MCCFGIKELVLILQTKGEYVEGLSLWPRDTGPSVLKMDLCPEFGEEVPVR